MSGDGRYITREKKILHQLQRTANSKLLPAALSPLREGLMCTSLQRHVKERKVANRLAELSMSEQPNPWRQVRWSDIKYTKDNLLGEGGFGAVYQSTLAEHKGVRNWPATQLAIKELSNLSDEAKDMFLVEMDILVNTYHPCICTIVAYDISPYRYAMVYYSRSLDKVFDEANRGVEPVWEDSENRKWQWNKNRCKCAFGIAAGLCYIHQQEIIHMDMKPENVMLDEQMRPKLVDFGLAIERPTEENAHKGGTPAYMAPEMFDGCRPTPACDVFAFGLIMYEILSGKQLPWVAELFRVCMADPATPPQKRLFICGKAITDPESRPELPEGEFPDAWRDIITRCWDVDPEKRPTMAEICQIMAAEEGFLLPEEDEDEFREYVAEVLPTLGL